MISEDAYDVVFHIISELWENEMGFAATEKFKSLKLKIEKNVSARMDRYRGNIFCQVKTHAFCKKNSCPFTMFTLWLCTLQLGQLYSAFTLKKNLAYQGFKSQKGIIP